MGVFVKCCDGRGRDVKVMKGKEGILFVIVLCGCL